jgi:hypothetical protein
MPTRGKSDLCPHLEAHCFLGFFSNGDPPTKDCRRKHAKDHLSFGSASDDLQLWALSLSVRRMLRRILRLCVFGRGANEVQQEKTGKEETGQSRGAQRHFCVEKHHQGFRITAPTKLATPDSSKWAQSTTSARCAL